MDSDSYRYGFNGKERDDEVKGSGVQYDYGFRVYDARLGKFLSRDPLFKSFAEYTPYQFAGNKVIVAIDLDGLEEYFYWNELNKETSSIELNLVLDQPGPVLAPDISEFGLYRNRSTAQRQGELIENRIQRESEAAQWRSAVEARLEYERLQNPVWMAYELSPFGAASSAFKNAYNGDYGWATLDLALGAFEVRGFLKTSNFKKFGGSGAISRFSNLARFGLSDGAVKQLGEIVERIYKSRNRPSFRKGVVDDVWDNAPRDINGNVVDPNTGDIIKWEKGTTRKGVWDMGHTPGNEWHKLRQEYIDGKKTWEQVLDEYNDPKKYQVEEPSSNRSGANEGSERPTRG